MKLYSTIAASALFSISLVCSGEVRHEDSLVADVAKSVVLVRAKLLHGFAEDRKPVGRWVGAGFLVDRDKGWIITNRHVAGIGPAELTVQFVDDDVRFEASRIYVDAKHDIAVLKIQADSVPPDSNVLSLECGYRLKRGDKVAAVGHPESHHFTATRGVLSGRKDLGVDGMLYTTDMVTEPGSSGSPVVRIETGKVIGVSTAGYESSDLGLITRVRDFCTIYDLLNQGEDPSRPIMPFQMLMVDSAISNRIGHVFDEAVGFESGDVVMEINGREWNPKIDGELEDNLRRFNQGSVSLTVLRQGAEVQVELPINKRGSLHDRAWVHFSGVTLAESPHQDINFRNGGRPGAVVTIQSVDDSYDDAVNLEYDDYSDVISLDGVAINSLRQAYELLKQASDDNRRIPMIAREWDMTVEAVGYQFEHTFSVEDLSSSFDSQ